MTGKIIKGIAGFYYVHVAESGVYECKAKGIFRNRNIKPTVGDNVEIEVLSKADHLGNINVILPRRNTLVRPAVTNVDQAIIIFALKDPVPNLQLLDKFLIQMNKQRIPVVICFNKSDLIQNDQIENLKEIYKKSGAQLIFVSAKNKEGIDLLCSALKGKTSTVAGPSGVGKSSIINTIQSDVQMEIGVLSEKIKRGKHTTRHSQFIPVDVDTYILDTPGFSTLNLDDIEAEELKQYYPEFELFEPFCKYGGCNHIGETACGIKDAVAEGQLSPIRYEHYRFLYEELKMVKKY